MKRAFFSVAVALMLLAASTLPAFAEPNDLGVSKRWGAVREATAKYLDVDAAIADGYSPLSPCIVEEPGVMGIHYVRLDLFDTHVDPMRPEILLYVPEGGTFRLVGVEYAAIATSEDQRPPRVLGQPMDGPMPGHGPGEPEHFDLHVWLWAHNPSGLFAPFNPNLTCGD